MIPKSSHCAEIIISFPLSGTQRAATSATCRPPPSSALRTAVPRGWEVALQVAPAPQRPSPRATSPTVGAGLCPPPCPRASLTRRPNVNLQLEAGSVHHVRGRRSCRGAQSREKRPCESRAAARNPPTLHCRRGGSEQRPTHGMAMMLSCSSPIGGTEPDTEGRSGGLCGGGR